VSIEFSDVNNAPILIDKLGGFDRRAGKFKFDATWSFFYVMNSIFYQLNLKRTPQIFMGRWRVTSSDII
jgi:hypothetical protein